MMMVSARRVLILENDLLAGEMYASDFARHGLVPRSASTLSDAFDLLESELFSAAVVDLMLDDPHIHNTYDGEYALEACALLNEGTQCIIASAQDKKQIAARLGKKYGPFEYLDKEDIARDPALLTEAVLAATETFVPDTFTIASSVFLQLFGAAGVDSEINETNVVTVLEHPGRAQTFCRSASFALAPVLPLIPPTGSPATWAIANGVCQKAFWSKGLGRSVEVVVSRTLDHDLAATALHAAEAQGTHFLVVSSTRARGEFGGRLPQHLRAHQ
jgi:ActR/RegA family two-component response regulator